MSFNSAQEVQISIIWYATVNYEDFVIDDSCQRK